MGYSDATLHRVMDLLDHMGAETNMAPEAEQTPLPINGLIKAMNERHGHTPYQTRRAIDAALAMGTLCRWRHPDGHGDQRVKHVALTSIALATLKDGHTTQATGPMHTA
jgi:hypothetical protein